MRKSIFIFALALAGLARADWAIDAAFPATDTRVVRNAMLASGGVLYIGGDFSQVGGQPRSGIAAIELATGRLLPWAPRLLSPCVSVIVAQGDLIYVGGSFRGVEGQKQSYIAAYRSAGTGAASWVSSWRPQLEGPVADLLPSPEGSLYAAGRFESGVVEIEGAPKSGALTSFDPGIDGRVTSLLLDPLNPAALIIGGRFSHAGGAERDLIARIDRKSGRALPQQLAIQGGPSKEILRMISHSGTVYVVGAEIERVAGEPRANAFALDPQSFALKAWRDDLDAGAGALSAWGERVIIGGDFRHVNGLPRRLAAVDSQSGQVLDWDPQPDDNTYAALAMHGAVFVSGYWSHLKGLAAGHFAALRDPESSPSGRPSVAFFPPESH